MTFAKTILATVVLAGSVSAAFAGTTVFEGGATDLQPALSNSTGSVASRASVLADLRAFQRSMPVTMAWEGGEASRVAIPASTTAADGSMMRAATPRTMGTVRFGTFEGGEASTFHQQVSAMQDKAARVQ